MIIQIKKPLAASRLIRDAASGWVIVLLTLLLAAYFLFAHGCHSHADTELFTTTSESSSAAVAH